MREPTETKIQNLPSSAKLIVFFDKFIKEIISINIGLVLLLADVIAVALSYLLAYRLHLHQAIPLKVVILLLVWLIIFGFYGLYKRRISLSVIDQYPQIVQAVTMATIIITALSVFFSGLTLELPIIITTWLAALLLIPLERVAVRSLQALVRHRGLYQRNTLIVGAGQVGTIVARKLLNQPKLGLNLKGFVDRNPPDISERDDLKIKIFPNEDRLDLLVKKYNISQIVIAFSNNSHKRTLKIIRECEKLPVEFSIVPRLFEVFTTSVDVDEIEGIPIMNLKKVRLEGYNLILRLIFDLILSSLILVLMAPFFLVLAAIIKLDSSGPVFFRQQRVGKGGRLFTMLKFRSMVVDAESIKDKINHLNEADGPLFQIKNDPRITRVGKFIRKFSIDELPQFINVIKGDMSIVGPRPALPEEVEKYEEWQKRRLNVIPGITGFWQVLGRNELPFEEMIKLDLNYIQNWSLGLNFKLILKTITAIFRKRGAY